MEFVYAVISVLLLGAGLLAMLWVLYHSYPD
jgi:hypothetical protein